MAPIRCTPTTWPRCCRGCPRKPIPPPCCQPFCRMTSAGPLCRAKMSCQLSHRAADGPNSCSSMSGMVHGWPGKSSSQLGEPVFDDGHYLLARGRIDGRKPRPRPIFAISPVSRQAQCTGVLNELTECGPALPWRQRPPSAGHPVVGVGPKACLNRVLEQPKAHTHANPIRDCANGSGLEGGPGVPATGGSRLR